MWGFIIAIASVFAFLGGVIGYLRHDEEKSVIVKIAHTVWGAIIGLVVIGAITGAVFLNNMKDRQVYNNGVCEVCGGEYHLVGVEGCRMGTHHFYYECEDCHHTIDTTSRMK